MRGNPSRDRAGALRDDPAAVPRGRPWQSILLRGLLAAPVAVAIELLAFRASGLAIGTDFAALHLTVLLIPGMIVAAVAALSGRESWASRFWLLAPGLASLTPWLLDVAGALAAVAILAGLAVVVARVRPLPGEAAPLGAAAGALAGLAVSRLVPGGWYSTGVTEIVLLASVITVIVPGYGMVAAWQRMPLPRTAGGAAAMMGVMLGAVAVLAWPADPPGLTVAAAGGVDAGPPIVIIVLDTVRADHLEIYGYPRSTMPGLARFAESEAVVVDRAIANAPHSLPSHASLFTGLFPARHGAHLPLLEDVDPPSFAYPIREDVSTLPELLARAGYVTVAVVSNCGPISAEAGFGHDRGFAVYRSQPVSVCTFMDRSPWRGIPAILARLIPPPEVRSACNPVYRRADEITDEAIARIDGAGESSFFLFVNYMDAHQPYAPPATFGARFPGFDSRRADAIVPGSEAVERVLAGGRLSPEFRDHVVAAYDGELAYLDSELERLLTHLRAQPRWEEMLVVITADHGEALGEHDFLGHGALLYDTHLRVPMVLRFGTGRAPATSPGPGGHWERPMQLVDLMPLVLRYAGIDVPDGLDGREPDEPPVALRAWSFPMRSQLRFGQRFAVERRSIEWGGWKLIAHSDGMTELFELAADPKELRNLADAHPDRVARMLAELGPSDPYRRHVRPALDAARDSLARLRALGYVR